MTPSREGMGADVERALIGGLLLEPTKYAHIANFFTAEHLVEHRHRTIYRAITAVADRGEQPDAVLVHDELERAGDLAAIGGHEYLASLIDDTPSAAAVESYARRLSGQTARLWPAPLDLRTLLATPPTPPRMVIDDWLPCGYATLLAGHGGAGKSSMALHLAVCIATGRAWWGMHCASRRVLYLSCEDRADVIHWRLARICTHEELDAADLGGLHVEDLVGHETILYRRDPAVGMIATAAFGELRRRVEEVRAEVLVVDGVSDTFAGNENDRADVKAFINVLIGMMGPDGVVVLVHHVNKAAATAGNTSEGYSGSTQWHNGVRARWYLHPETEQTDEGSERTGRLVLALQKSNLGRDDQSMRLRWDDDAHMFLAEGSPKPADRHMRDEDEQHGIVMALCSVIDSGDYCPAATTGNRTAFRVLSAAPEFPRSLLGSPANRRRFWSHIEMLRRMGTIDEGSIRRKNRTYTATLVLKAAPHNGCTNAPNESAGAPPVFGAGASAPNAPNGAGGYRGSAHTHGGRSPDAPEPFSGGGAGYSLGRPATLGACPHCDGEGCHHCGTPGAAP